MCVWGWGRWGIGIVKVAAKTGSTPSSHRVISVKNAVNPSTFMYLTHTDTDTPTSQTHRHRHTPKQYKTKLNCLKKIRYTVLLLAFFAWIFHQSNSMDVHWSLDEGVPCRSGTHPPGLVFQASLVASRIKVANFKYSV